MDESVKHFGVLGMHWGRRKASSEGSNSSGNVHSKTETKLIKQRKNEMLNKVVETDMAVNYHVMTSKFKVTEDHVINAQSKNDSNWKKLLDEHMSEKAEKANAYLKDNPSLVPKGMTIKYDPKKYNADDFELSPDYTYNGKSVDFSFGSSKSDSVFLEPPNEIKHYGVLGMHWGRRKASNSDSNSDTHKQLKEMVRREKILKNPGKLYRHRKEFTKEEIQDAMNNMRMERELKSLDRDRISSGSQYANTILAYGTVAVSAYNLYKSPIGQMAVKKVLKK